MGVSCHCYEALFISFANFAIELRRHYTGMHDDLTDLESVLTSRQHVHGRQYRLHAILLSRSPYLAHLMSTSPTNASTRNIYVPIEDEVEVTEEVSVLGSARHDAENHPLQGFAVGKF
jgi:hypothetical protein